MATPAITILHLSDLHFGRKHRFEQEGLGALLSRVVFDLDEYAAKRSLRPDVVVLSGDFAEYGKRDEFDRAATFVRGLRAHLRLPARRFVLVPGNHDVNWNKSKAYFEDCEGDGVTAVEPYFRKFVHFESFFDAFYEGEEGIQFSEQEPWSFFEIPDLGVGIAGLNSAFAESHRETDHHRFLGEAQIRAAAGRARVWKERGYLRIGVLHHDPRDPRGGSRAAQDQKDFERLLVPELNLVLHGDIHEETTRYLDRDVPALGVGSAAVGVDERGPDISNEVQWLVVRADGVERHLRAWVSDQKRWTASPRADKDGESGVSFVRADFQGVSAFGRMAAPAPTVDLAAIVERYRQSVVRRQGSPTVFDLLGVGENEESGGLDFLRLFVPQRASPDRRGEGPSEASGNFLSAGMHLFPAPTSSSDVETARSRWLPERPHTVDALFDRRRLMLVGAPGAGKSALTRWALLKLCVPGERLAGVPEDAVPVLVELRTFDQAHRNTGSGYTVFDHVARGQADFHGPLTVDHLRALAEKGRVLWLFDGLDEITDPTRRREMAERIAGLLDEHPNCRAVVTSRIAGVEVARPTLEGAGFQTYVLQELTDGQRELFLESWHALAFRRDPATGAERRKRLSSTIETTPSLQALCKNPLLCAMLAYLHREESLPQRRHLLYQKVLERMAEHWDANKGLPLRPSAERFELADKLAFLRELAWHMQSEQERAGNAISRGALEDFAARFCEARWAQPPDAARRRAEALIEQLYERGAVLAYLGGESYGFSHRAFLEHLAASEAIERYRSRVWGEEDLCRLVALRWPQPAWEETLLLLFGQLRELGESGCDCVIRLLQAIAGGRAATIYRLLEKYVLFSIKGLSELPQLERGAPGDFARALSSVVLEAIRRGVVATAPLKEAFRRCAGRWPDVDALERGLLTIVEAGQEWRIAFYDSLIAAGGAGRRMDLLIRALAHADASAYFACYEAARFGAFSATETSRMLAAVAPRGEQDRLDAIHVLVNMDNTVWAEGDEPIRELADLLAKGSNGLVRTEAAWLLLCAGCHDDLAVSVLVQVSLSPAPSEQEEAVTRILDLGHRERFVQALADLATSRPTALVKLAELAADDDQSLRSLGSTVEYIRSQADAATFCQLAATALAKGFKLFTEDEILERWKSITDARAARNLVWQFRGDLRIRACVELLSLEPRLGGFVWEACKNLTPQRAGKVVHVLWSRLLDLQQPLLSVQVAQKVLTNSAPASLRDRARGVVEDALAPGASESEALLAALLFILAEPAAEARLAHLAKHAQDEKLRLAAAAAAGDLTSLNEIGAQVTDEEARSTVRDVLDFYGDINALLQVGKLRRARVRFEGRDVGVIEELTRVGNGTRFRYDANYDGPPIAPNMPVDARELKDEETLLPFFANLLPEGALYEQTARKLGVKRSDRFGVLLGVGSDTMGAVEVLPMETV